MNFAEIETMWHSPHNRPNQARMEEIKMKFVTDLKKRHRGTVIFLWFIFLLLSFFTTKMVLQVIWPDPAWDKVDLLQEWGLIPFVALPWAGWAIMVALHRRHQSMHPNYAGSIHASVAALLDENQVERTRQKVIAGLLVLSALVLPIVVHQLQAVGKAGNEIVMPAFVIYPSYVALALVGSAWRYRRKLLPRKRELEALLASYR
jgi:hypothetical protein